VECTRAMIDHLPFVDRSFDAVTCLNTLLNLPSLDVVGTALNEMMRVSDGKVIVDIRNGDNPVLVAKYWWHRRDATFATVAYRLRDITRIFQLGGFDIEHAYPIGLGNRLAAWGYVVVAERTGMND
ncbi:MAG: methyltransferase domain-containing protein, partial [Candidatus Latescibacteria bacterium]|nr:methyltransferase domain-containing protein [Candidatus Latescibacterota bacterium]